MSRGRGRRRRNFERRTLSVLGERSLASGVFDLGDHGDLTDARSFEALDDTFLQFRKAGVYDPLVSASRTSSTKIAQ